MHLNFVSGTSHISFLNEKWDRDVCGYASEADTRDATPLASSGSIPTRAAVRPHATAHVWHARKCATRESNQSSRQHLWRLFEFCSVLDVRKFGRCPTVERASCTGLGGGTRPGISVPFLPNGLVRVRILVHGDDVLIVGRQGGTGACVWVFCRQRARQAKVVTLWPGPSHTQAVSFWRRPLSLRTWENRDGQWVCSDLIVRLHAHSTPAEYRFKARPTDGTSLLNTKLQMTP